MPSSHDHSPLGHLVVQVASVIAQSPLWLKLQAALMMASACGAEGGVTGGAGTGAAQSQEQARIACCSNLPAARPAAAAAPAWVCSTAVREAGSACRGQGAMF